ncbi:hypothetical protein MAR_017062 [Mya arenaria]|uniref:Uncharacterized protein n=1 Tax=Mya arenaria TaxID=6604 RepID=A0ABY7EDC4_MYAAR|nr:hypothetical protein MAR_017062 [Mya arenaria]
MAFLSDTHCLGIRPVARIGLSAHPRRQGRVGGKYWQTAVSPSRRTRDSPCSANTHAHIETSADPCQFCLQSDIQASGYSTWVLGQDKAPLGKHYLTAEDRITNRNKQ